jgi:hypothetical protein
MKTLLTTRRRPCGLHLRFRRRRAGSRAGPLGMAIAARTPGPNKSNLPSRVRVWVKDTPTLSPIATAR